MAGGVTQRPKASAINVRQPMWPQNSQVLMVNYAKNFAKSGMVFGALGSIALVYFTDWKPVIRYIPFYNGKLNEP